MDVELLELLAKVSELYFHEGLTQAQIASQVGYSRSMISRLLTEARQQGVVEILIHQPLARRYELEQTLQSLLGLKIVRVLVRGTLSYEQMQHRLGSLSARLVEELVYDRMTLGVSWGYTIAETIQNLRPRSQADVHVVQMIGSAGPPQPEVDGSELSRHLARTFTGTYSTLPVPLFVDSETTRQLLLNDTRIRQVVARFKDIELALVGVGTVVPERSALLRANYLNEAQLDELYQTGAVGDVCVIHFDINGQVLDVPLARRVMGIDAVTLAGVPMKLGVAGGQYKSKPIIGASRAGLINMLVTDEVAATGIIDVLKVQARL